MAMKRPAANAESAAAKKPKVAGREATLCDQVRKGLKEAEHLPEVAQQCLADMLETSLLVYKDARHKYQEGVVEMVANTFTGIEAQIQARVDEAEKGVAGAGEEKVTRTAAVAEADGELKAKVEETNQRKRELAEDAWAFKAAKETLWLAKDAQEKGEMELKGTVRTKDVLEAAARDLAKPLTEATVEGDQVPALVKQLVPILNKHEFGESMIASLPNVLAKSPSERGQFDTMVVTQMNEELALRVKALEAKLEEAAPAREQRAETVKAAEEKFQAAREKQLVSANTFTEAQAAQEEATIALRAAKEKLRSLNPETRKCQKSLTVAAEALEKFRKGPLAAFQELAERTTPAPVEEAEATAEAPEGGPAPGEAAGRASSRTRSCCGMTGRRGS